MKRKLALLMALALTVSLAACGNSGKEGKAGKETTDSKAGTEAEGKAEDKPEKLVMVTTTDHEDLYSYVADEFYEKYGIDVDIISLAYADVHDKEVTMALGESQLDILTVDTVWPGEFAKSGIARPLNEYFTEEEIAQLYPAFVDEMSVGDDIYAIPTMTEGKWLFYNKEMLEEAGYSAPPSTYDEMLEMSRNMMDKGICKHGTAWAASQAEGFVCDFNAALYAYGGEWINENGDFVFNSKAGVDALNMFINSMKDNTADPASVSYSDRDNLDPFMAGDTAFVTCWSYAYDFTNDPANSSVAGKVEVAIAPGQGEVEYSATTGGGGLGITSSCKYPEWAVEFIKIAISYEVQKDVLDKFGNMPILKRVLEDPEILKDNPEFEIMAKQFDYAHGRPTIADYSSWSKMLQLNLSKALAGEVTAQEALDEAVRISNQEYK